MDIQDTRDIIILDLSSHKCHIWINKVSYDYFSIFCATPVLLSDNMNENHNNNNTDSEDHTSTVDQVRVINLSNYNLTEPELALLSKGLNFCPSPGEPNSGELRQDLDNFHRDLRRYHFFHTEDNDNNRDPPRQQHTTKCPECLAGRL